MKKHFLNLALWALIPMSLCVHEETFLKSGTMGTHSYEPMCDGM